MSATITSQGLSNLAAAAAQQNIANGAAQQIGNNGRYNNGGYVGIPLNPGTSWISPFGNQIWYTPNTSVIPAKPSALDIVKKINSDGIANQAMEELGRASQ